MHGYIGLSAPWKGFKGNIWAQDTRRSSILTFGQRLKFNPKVAMGTYPEGQPEQLLNDFEKFVGTEWARFGHRVPKSVKLGNFWWISDTKKPW